jgi:hypothetical protein
MAAKSPARYKNWEALVQLFASAFLWTRSRDSN